MTLLAPAVAVVAVALVAHPEASARPPTVIPPRDFVEYWAAARVHLRGGDPYDGPQLLPLQKEAEGSPLKSQPTMLWTPPWTLPLYLPFGLLDPRPAHLLWLAVQLGCVLGSVVMLWKQFSGPTRPLWWLAAPILIAATFGPTWWLLGYGQNAGFVLIGLAGFLALRGKGYPFAAGVVAALMAVKPHLLAPFGLVMLLDGFATPAGRRLLLGGAVALLAAVAVALVPNPDVFAQFAEALARPSSHANPSVTAWQVPLIAYKLRWALDPDGGTPFWTQFVPCAAACAAAVPYWWLRRKTWDWTAETPRLVLASLLLAPYGAWPFDLTILLVPVVQTFARVARDGRLVPVGIAVAGHLAVSLMMTTLGALHDAIWVTPAVIVWYLAVAVLARPAVSSSGERRT